MNIGNKPNLTMVSNNLCKSRIGNSQLAAFEMSKEQETILGFPTDSISKDTLLEIVKLLMADSKRTKSSFKLRTIEDLSNAMSQTESSERQQGYEAESNRIPEPGASNKPLCQYYLNNRCKFGQQCRNMHEIPAQSTKATANNLIAKQQLCHFCGQSHQKQKEKCPAWQKSCYNCKGLNHFKEVCQRPRNKSKCKSMDNNVVDHYELKTANSSPAAINVELNKAADKKINSTVNWTEIRKKRKLSRSISKIERDEDEANAKYFQESKTTDLQPCLWCTRRTTLKCSKCQWAYCSRRCAFSDPLHNSYDTCSYENFCALCVDTKGYCNIHKSPDKAQAENE